MKTDSIIISSEGKQMELALEQAEKVAAYKGLTGKNALHLRLLTEEMMGLMRSIVGKTEGEFWIEDDGSVYQLHLKVNAFVDELTREQLLAVSSSGKNEAAKGLMGKLRDFFYYGAAPMGSPLLLPEMFESPTTATLDWEWSMMQYEDALNARLARDDEGAREAWDELEKSVVAKVADDVKVAIRGRTVELTILKKMA